MAREYRVSTSGMKIMAAQVIEDALPPISEGYEFATQIAIAERLEALVEVGESIVEALLNVDAGVARE